MKRIVVAAVSLVALGLTSVVTFGQAKLSSEAPSLLYQVSGKGLSKPSYLFGTFHAVCATEMVPLETLDPYLAQSDQLMMEIDMDDPAEMQSMAGAVVMPNGKTLKDFLTAEQFAKVDAMVKDLLGYSAENVKMVRPLMLSVLLSISPKAVGCTPTVYDQELMKRAVGRKLPVAGLETVAAQLKVLDAKPLEEQAKDLYEMANDPQKSIKDMKALAAAYKERDSEKLYRLSDALMTKDRDFQRRLLDDRNLAWIPQLETAFRAKPTFVAVGAGHLGGPKGVVKLLRDKGYQVKPVKL